MTRFSVYLIQNVRLKLFLFIITFLFAQIVFSQNDFLAKQYLTDGDFEKALVYYEKLVQQNPRRSDYNEGLVECYQQLERYSDAENLILQQIKNRKVHPTLFIELGYNHTLQKQPEKAKAAYTKALKAAEKNPNYAYSIGAHFQKRVLLDYAVEVFSKAMEKNPQLNYNFQLARIYGEQGAIEKMYQAYLDLILEGKTSKSNVLRSINDFISEDATSENNIKLKKTLLLNAQKNPDVLWNELLSWLFVQQKQYKSAFNQEKGIYKRADGASLQRIESLGSLTLDQNELEIATSIFEYIIEKSTDESITLNAELNLISILLKEPTTKKITQVETTFKNLLSTYGYKSNSLQLQIAYANFLTFKKNTPEPAITILKNALEIPLNTRGKAYVKMALGDILVYDKKFNQALIYFSQIQKNLKNDVVGQNARYKVAQTSFYKGDFDWALTQLKVLRGSTSQLIANDAMQLSLLISDNSLEDSTQTALKKYARADLLAYQNKTKEAVATLNDILENHKGEKIEDEALLRQGKLLEKQKKYDDAILNYTKIIEFFGSDILADDAHFALAELYKNNLENTDKAKAHYEKIIYNHQDSYYYPQAVKNFRTLRGDNIN